MFTLGDGEERRIAIGAGASVQVEDDDFGGLLSECRQDFDEGTVGPDRTVAAVEQTVWKIILAGFHDRGDANIAAELMLRGFIGLRRGIALRPVPGTTDERSVQGGIAFVFRRALRPVDEIAVEIDVVFVHPTRPGGAPGVDEVDC
ncbi:hypothetical protein D9M68_758580 [compost metagenome]